MDLLDRIEPPVTMKNKYSEMLFNGSLPSSTGFGEKKHLGIIFIVFINNVKIVFWKPMLKQKIYMF